DATLGEQSADDLGEPMLGGYRRRLADIARALAPALAADRALHPEKRRRRVAHRHTVHAPSSPPPQRRSRDWPVSVVWLGLWSRRDDGEESLQAESGQVPLPH